MRVAIAGAGSVGTAIAADLRHNGHDVLVLDSLWEHGGGRRANVPDRVSFVHMDIRDENVSRIFTEFKPEIVSHHAAQHSVAISSRDPIYDAQVNVVGLLGFHGEFDYLLDRLFKERLDEHLFIWESSVHSRDSDAGFPFHQRQCLLHHVRGCREPGKAEV